MIGIRDWIHADLIYNKGRNVSDKAEPIECFLCAACGKEQEKPALCCHDKLCNTCCWIIDNGFPTVEALERDLIKFTKSSAPLLLAKGWNVSLSYNYLDMSDGGKEYWVVTFSKKGGYGKPFFFEAGEIEKEDDDQDNKLGKLYVEMMEYASALEVE